MAIEAKVAWKSDERHTGGPYWVMVDPIGTPLGSRTWNHASIASGVEVTLAVANKDGEEIPSTRVKVLGYKDKVGGQVNGVELLEDPKDWVRLGDCQVVFYRFEKRDGFADDLQALLRFNREQLNEKVIGYVDHLKTYRKMRKTLRGRKRDEIEWVAGKEILDGLDSGLLKIVID